MSIRAGWLRNPVVLFLLYLCTFQSSFAAIYTPGKFSVSASGAATYAVNLAAPPGTSGMEPKLSLFYNSQGGNGLLGMGWSLSGLSAITRCPQTLAQDGIHGGVNFDANDRYCLDGQRLVVLSGAYGAVGAEYRTERDGFSRIVSYGGVAGDPQWFKVWTKSGQVLEYGNTADSRIEAQGKTAARVWSLNRISDTVGNYLTLSYYEDNANGDYYPTRIDYTGYVSTTGNSSAVLAPYNSVQFVYAARPDVTTLYQAGSLIKNSVRLTDIKTYAGTSLVKDYKLSYDQSASTQRSRITTLQECDGGATQACLQATVLGWQAAGGNANPEAGWGTRTANYNTNALGFRMADAGSGSRARGQVFPYYMIMTLI